MSEGDGIRDVQRRQLGAAIRRRRHARELTLAQLSAPAGVSVSMLSQVERGLLDPSLDTLRRIADALGTVPFRLLEEQGAVVGIVRRGSGRAIVDEDGGFRFEVLSPSLDGAFAIAVWELQPGHSSASRPRAHPAEEASLFLQGRGRLEIGDEAFELTAGDCITFDPARLNRLTATGDEPVICVNVISPAPSDPMSLRWPDRGAIITEPR
jgi:transcriptional regulator with XRE-family HTH domain